MYYKTLLIYSLLSTSPLLAFQDSDIDGVKDSMDLCPDSSFDLLVDAQGCASNQKPKKRESDKYYGALTLKLGNTFRTDEYYEDENYLDLYANYRYHQWDIAISNSQSTTKSSSTEDNSDSDSDIYLSTGYSFTLPQSKIRLSIGTKIVDDNEYDSSSTKQGRGIGSYSQEVISDDENPIENRDNDYFVGLNYSYFLNNKQDLFAYYGYTQSGDSSNYDYENYSSFSLGTGYAFSPKLYTAISYNYTGSIYQNADAEERITAYGSYGFSKNIFATASYSYGLDEYSYDHAFALALGFYFQ